METFRGNLKVVGGEIHTWYELIAAAIDARTYSSDAPTNTHLRAEMKGRFRGCHIYVRRFYPAGDIYLIDAFKGNSNGIIDQAAWTLPGDVTGAAPGTADKHDGGVEYKEGFETGSCSQAIYAAADTEMSVTIVVK